MIKKLTKNKFFIGQVVWIVYREDSDLCGHCYKHLKPGKVLKGQISHICGCFGRPLDYTVELYHKEGEAVRTEYNRWEKDIYKTKKEALAASK